MAVEGGPSSGREGGSGVGLNDPKGEPNRGVSLQGSFRERFEKVFSARRQEELKPVGGEPLHVFQLLQQLNAAKSLEAGRQLLIGFRTQHGFNLITPRFPDKNGNPKIYEIGELLISLREIGNDTSRSLEQIPRPIRGLCARLRSGSQLVERQRSENSVKCIDQNGKRVRIPDIVVLRIQSEQGVQLNQGSRITYGEGYENTLLLNSGRKATDPQSISEAIDAHGYYWIIPARAAMDEYPIVIKVVQQEYVRLYNKLPPVLKK